MVASRSDDLTQVSQSASTPLNAVRRSIVVRAPVERAYAKWARIEDLPKFITALRNVRRIDNSQFSYTWQADGEERAEILQIVLQIHGRRIAWRMVSNALISGVVSFEPRSAQETEVTLKIRSTFDVPNLSCRLEEYLGNFKQLIESEEQ